MQMMWVLGSQHYFNFIPTSPLGMGYLPAWTSPGYTSLLCCASTDPSVISLEADKNEVLPQSFCVKY